MKVNVYILQVFFSHHFGNMTRPLELGSFCVILHQIGERKFHTSNWKSKSKFKELQMLYFILTIGTFDIVDVKYNDLC